MSVLLDTTAVTVTGSSSRVSFQTEGGGHWEVWDRYIAIDGQKAFHIGNICQTCSFFFQRLDGANRSFNVDEVGESLNAGLSALDPAMVEKIQMIVPNGNDHVLLLRAIPTLVQPGGPGDYFSHEQRALWEVGSSPGLPHFPNIDYYRLSSRFLPDRGGLYELLVPTFPQTWLAGERVTEYMSRLRAGEAPTAITLSVLDGKQPADWDGEPRVTSHWCFTHYLLDGHHKVFAASQAQLPITLLAFFAFENGRSNPAEVETLIGVLAGDPRARKG